MGALFLAPCLFLCWGSVAWSGFFLCDGGSPDLSKSRVNGGVLVRGDPGEEHGPRYTASALPQKLGMWVLLRLLAPPAVGDPGLWPLGDIQLEFLGHFDGPWGKKMEHSGPHQREKPWEVSAPELQAENAQRVSSAASPEVV